MITVVPFSAKVRADPAALRVKVVPAGRALTGTLAPELGPGPVAAQEEHQLRAAAVPEVEAEVEVGPSSLGAHGGADPLAAGELGGGQLDLGRLVAGISLGRTDVAGVAAELVPCTCWLTMVRPPSAISVQLGPRLPLARAKLSEGSPAPPPAVVVVVVGTVVVVVLGGSRGCRGRARRHGLVVVGGTVVVVVGFVVVVVAAVVVVVVGLVVVVVAGFVVVVVVGLVVVVVVGLVVVVVGGFVVVVVVALVVVVVAAVVVVVVLPWIRGRRGGWPRRCPTSCRRWPGRWP